MINPIPMFLKKRHTGALFLPCKKELKCHWNVHICDAKSPFFYSKSLRIRIIFSFFFLKNHAAQVRVYVVPLKYYCLSMIWRKYSSYIAMIWWNVVTWPVHFFIRIQFIRNINSVLQGWKFGIFPFSPKFSRPQKPLNIEKIQLPSHRIFFWNSGSRPQIWVGRTLCWNDELLAND